jgi:hypothetical protein
MNLTNRRFSFAKRARFPGTFAISALVCVGCLFSHQAHSAVTPVSSPMPVAVTGFAAPAGGNYTRANAGMGVPSLNDAGQVAFKSAVFGSTSSEGFFAGTPGTIQNVALLGNAAPGGGNFTTFNSSTPTLNNSGQIVFNASLSSGIFGLFQGSPGSLQSNLLAGQTTPSGGTYGSFAYNSQNNSGQVAFTSRINNGPSSNGMFLASAGSVQTVLLQGDAAPGGGTFGTFDTLPLLNDAGQLAFLSSLNNSPSTSGVFLGTPGNVQAIALRGTPAPRGGVFNTATHLQLNSVGQVAFLTTTFESGVGLKSGMFIGTPNSVQAIVLSGDQIPSGGSLTFGSVSGFALNSAGQVAFQSPIFNGAAESGVFVGTTDSLTTVALEGTSAPGGGTFKGFSNPSLNNLGQIAFLAELEGPGVSTINDRGLYAGLPGNLVKVVRKGDVVDMDPGVGINLRLVTDIDFIGSGSGENGRVTGFNESGMLVYRLDVGQVGVFTSQLTPIPEPSTYALGAVCLIGLIIFARKRQHRPA